MEARLLRLYGTRDLTLGLLTCSWLERPLWVLERGWRGNAPNVSCIPGGEYRVAWTPSRKFRRNTWQVLDVPGRSGIRFHAGNYASQVQGCILTGLKVGKGAHGLGVWNSRSALALVERPGHIGAHFTLTISGLTI